MAQSEAGQPGRQVPVPRLASTLLIVRDDPFEVLMLRRQSRGSFPSALVFPGGVVEPADSDTAWLPLLAGADELDAEERAFRIAAIRETWEEASVLVAHDGTVAADARAADSDIDFREFVAASEGALDLGQIYYFGHWLTPESQPKRWDTRFFLAAAPQGQDVIFDGNETVSAVWLNPIEALARHDSGEQELIFPTRMNMKRLAESSSVAEAIAATEHHPRVQVMIEFEQGDGGVLGRMPAAAGYGDDTNWIPTN